jgi:hypothetical protein
MKLSSAIVKIVLAMTLVVAVAAVITWLHYRKLNNSVDPRIVKARELYGSYNKRVAAGDYAGIRAMLDSADSIYSEIPHYADSWERGVLWNNFAALCITSLLSADSIPIETGPFPGVHKDTLILMANDHLDRALRAYETLASQYGGLSQEQVEQKIRSEFLAGLEGYSDKQKDRFLAARAREIVAALAEKDRRMSVCHTNLGIVARYQEDYLQAVMHYQTALSLWDRNLEAENNLNSLLGKPLKKRNFLQKLFPPQRGSNKTDSL